MSNFFPSKSRRSYVWYSLDSLRSCVYGSLEWITILFLRFCISVYFFFLFLSLCLSNFFALFLSHYKRISFLCLIMFFSLLISICTQVITFNPYFWSQSETGWYHSFRVQLVHIWSTRLPNFYTYHSSKSSTLFYLHVLQDALILALIINLYRSCGEESIISLDR